MNWFILALRNSFDFKGRARRREFGWFLLGAVLISTFVSILEEASLALALSGSATFFAVLNNIISLVFIIPQVSVTTRRLHDLGYSGWWQLLLIVGWLVLAVIMGGMLGVGQFSSVEIRSFVGVWTIIALVLFAFNFIMWLYLIFKDGQKPPNKYGESPKYPAQTEHEKTTTTLVS